MRARVRCLIPVAFLAAGCGSSTLATPQCSDNAGCSASEVCAQGFCFDALSVQYALGLTIQVASTEPDGTAWDDDGSPPDVEATLTPVSGGDGGFPVPAATWGVDETFSASWPAQLVTFDSDAVLSLDAEDSDPIGSDHICTVQFPDTATWLHAGGATLTAQSCQVQVVARPVPPAL